MLDSFSLSRIEIVGRVQKCSLQVLRPGNNKRTLKSNRIFLSRFAEAGEKKKDVPVVNKILQA